MPIANEVAIGCDWEIAIYSVDADAITRRIMLPGDECAVLTLSYDNSLHRLFVGRADGGPALIYLIDEGRYHENDDCFAWTVACSLYLGDVNSFVYGDNRGSVYAVHSSRPAVRDSSAISAFWTQRVDTPYDCDACRVSQLYEIWCLCEVSAYD
jgi:hypothetical protein